MKKIFLSENDMPKAWYNIAADLTSAPLPPLHPGTLQPLGPDDLAPLFPMALIEQEMSMEREIAIPDPVMEGLRMYRPSPLIRATGLEAALKTPAKIYFKYEGVSPAGSHKPNTAIAQAYYNKQEGVERIATETGAGQWGSSMALAGQIFGLEVKVYMVKVSYNQKPYRRSMMESWGAKIVSSPSMDTQFGQKILADDPDNTGSLGIAISEAVEDAATKDNTKYALGSVLNHVLLHQTVIGLEAKKQMEIAGDKPDIVIGCVGGGSNFAGLAFPYLRDKINGADSMVFQTEKQLKEFGDKLGDKKAPIEEALEELKKAHASQDVAQIDAAMEKINEAWKNASEEMYKAQADAQGGAPEGGQADAAGQDTEESADVEDVDFEEVK